MIGSIIGAAIQLGGGIFGGIKARRAMKRARRKLEEQERENTNWYNRKYNEDATQRAGAQRMLTRLEDGIRQRNRQATGAQAVTGGTDEGVAAAKEANNAAIADATSQITAAGEARKDGIEAQYMERKGEIDSQMSALEGQKAQNIAHAVGGVASAAGGLGEAADGLAGARKARKAAAGSLKGMLADAVKKQDTNNPWMFD